MMGRIDEVVFDRVLFVSILIALHIIVELLSSIISVNLYLSKTLIIISPPI